MKQTITRKGTFDSAHRVMHQVSACRFIHGHTYHYELTFEFDNVEDIGYAIDFKEIKRVACQFIEDYFDHGFIVNPKDTDSIEVCKKTNSKMWVMSLNGGEFCNPTAENIAKELFCAISLLMSNTLTGFEETPSTGLELHQIRLYETPNCFVDCYGESITVDEGFNFGFHRGKEILEYKKNKGRVEYDDRKVDIIKE